MKALEQFQLDGRVAIVTGSARGLGYQHALALAEAGAEVALCDLDLEACSVAAAAISAETGRRTLAQRVDVTQVSDIDALLSRVEETLGTATILVNNAARPSEGIGLDTVDEDLWRNIIDTNLSSCFYVGKRAAQHLIARGKGGSIINISSINALVISNIAPRFNAAYCTAKAGVAQLSKAMAAQWAPHGIRVNSLAPGYIRTAQTEASASIHEVYERNLRNTPMQRYGRIDELKGAIVFLASDASSFMTGGILTIDGGYTIW